jgi:hypothetical protein
MPGSEHVELPHCDCRDLIGSANDMGNATYSALRDAAQILSTNESERSRDGENGSLETHLDYIV